MATTGGTQPEKGMSRLAPATDQQKNQPLSNNAVTGAISRQPWSVSRSYLLLAALTFLLLLPFSGKAFHIDDVLFLRAAQQISHHPLDPYGFDVVWYIRQMPMWGVAQNPPLASYYMAAAASIAGWSERAIHLAFMLPAIALILGTYRLALRLTRQPLLAAAATLVAPGFLVSATSVMCDITMLALWVWAAVFWIEGLDGPIKPMYLALASVLVSASALTKYFGAALIPLLLVYGLVQKRKLGVWLAFLLIPVAFLAGYELWTRSLYGTGLLSAAFGYAGTSHNVSNAELSRWVQILVALGFAGGCALPALLFVPRLWSRKQILVGAVVSALLALAFYRGWLNLGTAYESQGWAHDHLAWVSTQLLVYVAGGICILALAVTDWWKHKDAASLLLLLWVFGTMVFTIFLNWVITARSILPLVPAAAILIARRIDGTPGILSRWRELALILPLALSGAMALWVASGDEALANAARAMANYLQQKTQSEPGAVEFEGHWGFQYYMEAFGARPLEKDADTARPGDLIVIPQNNYLLFDVPYQVRPERPLDVRVNSNIATVSKDLGAGFYASYWGPLPFAIGPVPNERYEVLRVVGGAHP
jgi:4-amino-4-deoxy-L-arabinose transferase-like glycosyltransferase